MARLIPLLIAALVIGAIVFVVVVRNKRADTREKDVKNIRKEKAELVKTIAELTSKNESLEKLVLNIYIAAISDSSGGLLLAQEIKNRVSTDPNFEHLIKGELQ